MHGAGPEDPDTEWPATDVGAIITRARRLAGLSQRELAERAGTSAAAICLYERGERMPQIDTLERIVRAAGQELAVGTSVRSVVDQHANARDLWQVLELADRLPREHSDALRAPVFSELAIGDAG